MVGAALLASELELNEDEAKKLAASVARIAPYYDDKLNPKLVAWVDLICVAGAIYGPRAIAINMRLSATAKPRPEPVPINRTQTRPMETPAPAATSSRPARSPLEMFGPEYFGANIDNG